jgi:hypothetical protein
METEITLFTQRNVDKVFEEQRLKMLKDCNALSDADILSSDLETLSQQVARPYHFDVPDILTDQLSRDEPIFQRNSNDADIIWYIPIRGDEKIFGYFHRNSPFSPVYPVKFKNGVMIIRTTVSRDRIADAKKSLDAIVQQIGEYLPNVKKILEIYNPRFSQSAKRDLENRRSELLANQKANETLALLAVPVRKRTDEVAQTFVPPARKTIPIPASSKFAEFTPVLELQAYDDILATITAMAHGIERSPKTFEGMDEEDIRIVLLIGLNAIYEGKATGETFNGLRKSDILIREADRNIFVAECLVWDGEVKFRKKLDDQLLDYVVWRDTKAALIVFNRTKNLTSVIRTIQDVLSKHPQYVKKLDSPSDTSFKYIFRRLDDPEQHFYLTCLAFNVPEKPVAA